MHTVSVTLAIKYEVSFAPHYKFLEDRRCYNSKTGSFIKKVYKSRCLGYNIEGKFYSLTRLRSLLRKPLKEDLPF